MDSVTFSSWSSASWTASVAVEFALGRGNGRKFQSHAGVQQVIDKPMRVFAFLLRLLAEMRLEPRQAFQLEPRGDGFVLQGGEKLQADLGIDGGGDFFSDERFHGARWFAKNCRSFAVWRRLTRPRLAVPLTISAGRMATA